MQQSTRAHTWLLHILIVTALGAALSAPMPAYASTFVVTVPLDAPDPFPGDGICGIVHSPTFPYSQGRCSLRAAIQEVNALAGPHEIRFA